MKAKLFLLCSVSTLTAYAADPPAQYNSMVLKTPSLTTQTERFQNFLVPRSDIPLITLGKSDFVFSGPLVEGFRRLPHQENLSRGQKFLRLPLVRLFVPKPMPMPPEGGKYFAWRSDQCSLPWTRAASRPETGKGTE